MFLYQKLVMKKSTLILLVFILAKTGFGQTSDTAQVNKIIRDTLPASSYIAGDSLRLDSLKKVNINLAEQAQQLSEIIELKKDQINSLKNSTKSAKDSLEKELQKLTGLKKNLDSTIKQLESLNKQVASKNDTLKNILITLDSLKKVKKENEGLIAENEKSIAVNEEKLKEIISALGQLEDSLHVIAKIKLKTDTKGQKYKIGIYVDRSAIIKQLEALEEKKVNKDSNQIADIRYEQIKLLTLLGPDGFDHLSQDSIVKIIDNKSWHRTLPRDFKTTTGFEVTEVRIDVNEGLIREIVVKTSFGTYRNLSEPINLVNIGGRLDDKLYRDGEKKFKDEYLILGEVIDYIPVNSSNDIPYTQFDITLFPDTTHKKDIFYIRESTSLNTYFDLAVFSDIKGLSGDANGLAQLTASAKFITKTKNIAGKALIPFNYVSFNGGLAKFDNEFKGTFIEPDKSVNRKDLLQRSTYYVGVKMNLLHWVLSPYPKRLIQDIQLNTGYNFIGSKMAAITERENITPKVTDTTFTNVTQNHIYIEPIISFNRFRNFNMTLSLPYSIINIKKSAEITNSEILHWIKPSIELMYYSKRNSSSKIFFRYNHWINLSDTKQAFTQMQLGYSANLSDLLGSKN